MAGKLISGVIWQTLLSCSHFFIRSIFHLAFLEYLPWIRHCAPHWYQEVNKALGSAPRKDHDA